MIDTTQIVEIIRQEFMERLKAKTDWGRNEVLQEFDRAITKAVLRIALTDVEEKDGEVSKDWVGSITRTGSIYAE